MSAKMTVPFFRSDIKKVAIDEVSDTLQSGWLTTGPKTKRFEAEFAEILNVKHAVALNSCTAALHLGLEALGVKQGDMVLIPAFTFVAGAEVVRYFDANPVFIDCDETLGMSPVKLEEAINAIKNEQELGVLKPPYGEIKAIMPMHYGGYVCNILEIMEIAEKHNIPVIEDAAHCVFSKLKTGEDKWEYAGRFGEIGTYSFYANKCITTGEGGMLVTDDDDLAERVRLTSLHGMNKNAWKRFTSEGSWYYEITAAGYKYNLTDMASALGLHELNNVDLYQEKRQRVAYKFNEAFAANKCLELPPEDANTRFHSWHLYMVRLVLENLTIDRGVFIEKLKEQGVMCSVHWMPLHLNPYYREMYGYGPGMFDFAESIWPRLVSLPIFPSMRDEEIEYVIDVVNDVTSKYSA